MGRSLHDDADIMCQNGQSVVTVTSSLRQVPQHRGQTPIRSVRIPDEIWEAVKRKAADRGESITDVILRALKRYLREYDD